MRRIIAPGLAWLTLIWSGAALAASGGTEVHPEQTELRAIVKAMKANPRGPFSRIRWFCNDGTILPPKAYACADHGGGRQHGEWSEDTLRLRDAGFPVANVMVGLSADDFGEDPLQQQHFRILVLEQFLIDADNGWILRGARYYRGAFQVEGEEASAYEFLSRLGRDPRWQTYRFPLLMEAARLIPHGGDDLNQAEVRGMATALNDKDPGFGPLRNKIHGRPDPADAARVREYAAGSKGQADLQEDYETLAAAIDALSARPDPVPILRAYADKVRSADLARDVRAGADRLAAATDPADRLGALAGLMARLRDGLSVSGHPLDTIDLILTLEAQVFQLGQTLPMEDNAYTRHKSLALMQEFAIAAYGVGLLTAWELDNLTGAFERLAADEVTLDVYRDDLRYLDRVPGWGARRLALYFEAEIEHLAQIEPFVREFIPDRMRGSPLLFYSRLLNPLAADAQRLAGVRQQMFGREVATGLRSLNPGLGRGTLRTLDQLAEAPEGTADSIAIVAETVSELPVVAGILTEHEGNSLSHVQLLARNLGVPNVVVGDELLPDIRQYLGRRIRVASSPGGVVRIDLDDETAAEGPVITQDRISIDVAKLDLDTQRLIPTSELGSADQGVRVGPKAAQVGKLTRYFPGQVAPGLAVPFGLFSHALMERETEPGGPSLFEWMTARFDQIQRIDDPVARNERTQEVLATIRSWFQTRPPNPGKLEEFLQSVEENFGPDGSFGVFVRSDTNVEDLPGFTGAGINLTVPNVVGFDNLIAAMRDVWASPFTERSFGWRQGIMADPEHVYASVLLHKSVNVDKSGVMVTSDADTGAQDYITVVLNEGVGGGVEGQAAETLLIRRSDGQVRLLGSATAPRKRVLLPTGGSELVPSSGAERLMQPADIAELLKVVERLPGWFDNVPEEERATTVADVEFGFLGDKLYLFQIRPFVQSKGAENNRYLQSLDAGLEEASTVSVDLTAKPGG